LETTATAKTEATAKANTGILRFAQDDDKNKQQQKK
jgi:hypothetical protein